MYAHLESAVKEHMVLVKSQYETGLSRASQEGGFSIASALDISNINPVHLEWRRRSAPDLPFYNYIMSKRKRSDQQNAKQANSHIDDDSEDDEWE
jgi:hypothetical protein